MAVQMPTLKPSPDAEAAEKQTVVVTGTENGAPNTEPKYPLPEASTRLVGMVVDMDAAHVPELHVRPIGQVPQELPQLSTPHTRDPHVHVGGMVPPTQVPSEQVPAGQ